MIKVTRFLTLISVLKLVANVREKLIKISFSVGSVLCNNQKLINKKVYISSFCRLIEEKTSD